jgi:hypothetical protein
MTISPAAEATSELRPTRERIKKPASPRIIPFFIIISLLSKKLDLTLIQRFTPVKNIFVILPMPQESIPRLQGIRNGDSRLPLERKPIT